MRDFPVSLKESADIQEIYRVITQKSFSIKDCRSLSIGNYGQAQVADIENISVYPMIIYHPAQEEQIESPIFESSVDEGMTDQENDINKSNKPS